MDIIKYSTGVADILPQTSYAFTASSLTASEIITMSDCRIAHTYSIVIIIPTFTNAVTTTFTIKDPSGATLYSQASLARTSTNVFTSTLIPLVDGSTFNLTISGVAGGTGGTITIGGSLVNIG